MKLVIEQKYGDKQRASIHYVKWQRSSIRWKLLGNQFDQRTCFLLVFFVFYWFFYATKTFDMNSCVFCWSLVCIVHVVQCSCIGANWYACLGHGYVKKPHMWPWFPAASMDFCGRNVNSMTFATLRYPLVLASFAVTPPLMTSNTHFNFEWQIVSMLATFCTFILLLSNSKQCKLVVNIVCGVAFCYFLFFCFSIFVNRKWESIPMKKYR